MCLVIYPETHSEVLEVTSQPPAFQSFVF